MQDIIYPGREWPEALPGRWSGSTLADLDLTLSSVEGSTALIVVHAGRQVFLWGDPAQKSSVASVRKSLINVLYGIYVAEGKIRLDARLAELDIDDIEGLSAAERGATVADLLAARSGVYHPSVYDTSRNRPARGACAPGARWFYNNWDFNVLGTILERATGRTVAECFYDCLALPLQMQDFRPEDGFVQPGPESIHAVYKFRLSARDLARVGLLYLRGGRWGDTQIVPPVWVSESVRPHSDLGGGRGYGYLWWTAEARASSDAMSIEEPIFYASGFGGQYIVVVPALDLVVVHRAARVDFGITHDRMGEILRLIAAAAPKT